VARVWFGVGGVIVGISAVVTATIALLSPAKAGISVSAPFTWEGVSWCPTYREDSGCDKTQKNGTGSSAAFYPSQVTWEKSLNFISLKMNPSASKTGAFNTQESEAWNAPAKLSEQINLPCNVFGRIENWPAFWLDTTGSWPAGGEIDVMEGLSGSVGWHYHYLNRFGANSAVGSTLPGFNACGTHTYSVDWTTSAITFYYDGRQVGRVTPSEIGVPIASGPMYVVNDYAASSFFGGPTAGNVSMEVLKFTATHANK
jgi:Glycosyl hydrolases family 16